MIVRYSSAEQWPAIEEIFFLSSSVQEFYSAEERRTFLDRWTGYYRSQAAEQILLWRRPDGRVAAYLMGCRDSLATKRLFREVDSYHVFADYFATYPAHFHVNCHPDFRGQGIGSRLVEAFLAACAASAIPGVHVVTLACARNVRFYHKLGLRQPVRRTWRGRELLMLATTIEVSGKPD